MDKKYIDYIKSPKWEAKKQELFKEKGKKCELCGSTKHIHVHHLTYERLYDELIIDLQPLCRTCHEKEHGRKFKFGAKDKKKNKPVGDAKKIKLDLRALGHKMPTKKERKENMRIYLEERKKKLGY